MNLLGSKKFWIIIGVILGLSVTGIFLGYLFNSDKEIKDDLNQNEEEMNGGSLTLDDGEDLALENMEEDFPVLESNEEYFSDDKTLAYQDYLNVVSDKILAANLTSDGYQVQYIDQNSLLNSVSINGSNKTELKNLDIETAGEINWSPNRKKFIYKNNNYYKIYDIEGNRNFDIPPTTTSIDWISDNSFVYKHQENQVGYIDIGVLKNDGSWEKTNLIRNDTPNLIVSERGEGTGDITFQESTNGMKASDLKIIEENGNDSRNILSNVNGLEVKWSPNGEHGIFSSVEDDDSSKITLWIMDSDGSNKKDLNISSFIRKVIWSEDSKYIFVAKPNVLPNDVILPNDYYLKKFRTADSFWKIRADNLEKIEVMSQSDLGFEVDAIDLFLSKDQRYLFFRNRDDNTLGRILLENGGYFYEENKNSNTQLANVNQNIYGYSSPETGMGTIILIISILAGLGVVVLYLTYKTNLFSKYKKVGTNKDWFDSQRKINKKIKFSPSQTDKRKEAK